MATHHFIDRYRWISKYNAILDEKKRAERINLGTALMTIMQLPTPRALFLLVSSFLSYSLAGFAGSVSVSKTFMRYLYSFLWDIRLANPP